MFTRVPTPYGKECGYDPDQVLPDADDAFASARRTKSYVDREGYFWLHRWRNEAQGRAVHNAISAELTKSLSRFQAAFLRRCMQGTLASNLCYDKIGDLVDRAYSKIDYPKALTQSDFMLFGHEDDVVCSFVDGVAARRGIPLAKRPAANAD
jgi:hypothetical protein